MKKYLFTGILLVLAIFAYAQEGEDCPDVIVITKKVQEATENKINEKTIESKKTNRHYISRLDVNDKGFMMLADKSKEYGHKAGGDFDKWKKQLGNSAEHYMFYKVADGIVDLYYEKLDEDEQFPQYLPKGYTIFDKNMYNDFFNNKYFNGNSFSNNHWQTGGNVDARLADLRKLAQSFANILGINIDPAKITFRTIEVPDDLRMPIITKTPRNDGVGGEAKWDDKVTSIEIDADELGKASISSAVSIIAEEVYHKYQMAVVQGKAKEESGLKKAQWIGSFNDDGKNGYGKIAGDLQKQMKQETNGTNRTKLEEKRNEAIHSYYNLAHEKDAKEFAGKMAAMEYFVRNIGNFKQD
jgi:hypothetical protein